MCDHPLTDTEAYDTADSRTVQSFGLLPEESLSALKAQLGLHMRDGVLAACAAYYRTLRRDPTTDELQLLDACVTACERSSAADSVLTSFASPREDIAAALSALVNATKDTRGKSPMPTLRRALAAGACEMSLDDARTGGMISLMTDAAFGALAARGQRPVRSLCIGDTGLRMALSVPVDAYPAYAPCAGDMVSLLTLPRKDEATYARLQHFLEEAETRSAARAVLPLEAGDLLAALLRFSVGCYADLSVIAPCGAPETLEGYLVVASEPQTRALLTRARARGFGMLAFARLTSDGKLTLAERDAVKLSLPVQAITSLCRPRAVSLQFNPNPYPTVPTCDHASRQAAANGWEAVADHPAGEPVVLGNTVAVHTTLPLTDALSPIDVQSAMMQAALRLVAAGGDFDTLEATAALALGAQDSPCALWSAALGWHRTVLALGLSTRLPVIVPTREAVGQLTVCLSARAQQIPESPGNAPICLRLFAAATDAVGLPEAAELRAMLSLTSRALAEGHIVGLRPLWDRPLGEALATVKDLTLAPAFDGAPEVSTPIFGLLVRSDEALTHGVLVGSLAPDQPADGATEPTGIAAPPQYSLIHRPTPVVLLPLLPSVDEPRGLIAYLRQRGADVRVLPVALTHEGCTALADAVFEADVLILNGDTEEVNAVLQHRRVRYALEQRMREHASLLAVRGAAAAVEQSGQIEALTEANAPDLALRLSLMPEGLERPEAERMLAYYR